MRSTDRTRAWRAALTAAVVAGGLLLTPGGAAAEDAPASKPDPIDALSARPHASSSDDVVASGFTGTSDAVGDGGPPNICQGDLTGSSAYYTSVLLHLDVSTSCFSDPSTWFPGITAIAWFIDGSGDGVDDFQITLVGTASGQARWFAETVSPDGDFQERCQGAPSTSPGENRITVIVPSSCLPFTTLRYQIGMLWDENPFGSTCTCPEDFAPEFSYAPQTGRDQHNRDGDGAAIASRGPGLLDAFVHGLDDGLYTRSFNGSSWSGYQSVGGVIRGTPAVASAEPGDLDVFMRGQDDRLYTLHREGGNPSGGFVSLGGILSSSPAVVSAAPGTLDVFVAGSDRALYTTHFDGLNWSPWRNLGGIILSTPAVASPSPGVITVFARGADNALYQQTGSGSPSTWSGWSGRGGIINTAPSAASLSPGTVDVYVRGQDLALYTTRFVGSGSTGWVSLGGIISGPPAAASPGAGDVDLLIRGQDDALWWNHGVDGSFSGWISLGGRIK